MKVNEDKLLDDYIKIVSLSQNPSYSKDRLFCCNLSNLNNFYKVAFNKMVVFKPIENSYYDALYVKKAKKDNDDINNAIAKYKDYYILCANNFLSLLKDNNFYPLFGDGGIKRKYTENDIREIVLDFFNYLGEDKYKIAKSMFDDERIANEDFKIEDYEGFCTLSTIDIRPYIFISHMKKDISFISILVHELAHSIEGHYLLNRYNKFYSREGYLFSEVVSRFYELEFLKYLEENRINPKETKKLLHSYYTSAQAYLNDLAFSDSKELEFEDSKYYVLDDSFVIDYDDNLIKEYKKDGSDDIISVEFDIMDPIKYGMGSYVAFHLSNKKEENTKEFNKKFDNYLSMRTLFSYEDILKTFNIDINDFLSGNIIKPTIENDMKKILKR